MLLKSQCNGQLQQIGKACYTVTEPPLDCWDYRYSIPAVKKKSEKKKEKKSLQSTEYLQQDTQNVQFQPVRGTGDFIFYQFKGSIYR